MDSEMESVVESDYTKPLTHHDCMVKLDIVLNHKKPFASCGNRMRTVKEISLAIVQLHDSTDGDAGSLLTMFSRSHLETITHYIVN